MNNWILPIVILAVLGGVVGWGFHAGWWAKLSEFFREVQQEIKKTSFPSKDEVMGTTIVVLVTSLVFAFYLWIADLVIVELFKVIGS
jgi:preprotein translocase subunit SecE